MFYCMQINKLTNACQSNIHNIPVGVFVMSLWSSFEICDVLWSVHVIVITDHTNQLAVRVACTVQKARTRRAKLTNPVANLFHFVVVWKKVWNDNCISEFRRLQHFLQLRKLSRAACGALAGRMLCRPVPAQSIEILWTEFGIFEDPWKPLQWVKLPNFGHNLMTDCAKESTKASIEADFCLFSLN